MFFFYKFVRFFLFLMSPELAHSVSLLGLKWAFQLKILPKLAKSESCVPFAWRSVVFKNPVGLAAGLDKNGDFIEPLAALGFGFLELGTVTPLAQSGNLKPRLFRLKKQKGIINRMGFNNKGVDYLVGKIEAIKNRDYVIGVNIGKNRNTPTEKATDDYLYCLKKAYRCADYITINISSPNTPGLRDLQSKENLPKFLEKISSLSSELEKIHVKKTLLFLKISADINIDEIRNIISTSCEFRLDGLVVSNTSTQHSILTPDGEGGSSFEEGGISGKPLFSLSTNLLNQCALILEEQNISSLLLIGVGGIDSPLSAQKKFQAGAKLIQVYSGFVYEGPKLIRDILKNKDKC